MVDLDDDALRDLHLRRPAHQVSPKAKMAWRISACIAWIFPIIGVGVWIFFDDDPTRRLWQYGVAAVIGLWALFSIVVVPWWRFKVHRWEVTDTAVHTQAGWLHQERRVAPISRIQTVDSEFGPIEQLIGLGTLTVTTASAAGELRVSGLDKETVQRLVADLTRITAKERGDAT